MKPTSKLIGTFQLGHINVDVYADFNDTCSRFWMSPNEADKPRIRVGFDQEKWSHVVDGIVHEAAEMLLCMKECRYDRSCKFTGDSADHLFIMDHAQFGDMCSHLARFLTDVLPVATSVYKWRKRK